MNEGPKRINVASIPTKGQKKINENNQSSSDDAVSLLRSESINSVGPAPSGIMTPLRRRHRRRLLPLSKAGSAPSNLWAAMMGLRASSINSWQIWEQKKGISKRLSRAKKTNVSVCKDQYEKKQSRRILGKKCVINLIRQSTPAGWFPDSSHP